MKFLDNAPIGEDLFDGKSQELIAESIVKQLKENAGEEHRSKHQKMIGIEGSWGSGKSNLLKLVERKINGSANNKSEKNFQFFTYDVWGHQEDLQRKAILNELVDFVITKRIVKHSEEDGNDFNWREKVKRTTGIITETKQIQIPKVSWGIFICAIIFLLTPVCEVVAGLDFIADTKLSVVIAAAPLGLLLLLYPFWLLRNCCKSKRFPNGRLCAETFSEILSIYKDKEIESTNREYVSEQNPSVLDFRSLLYELSASLENAHLVVFFDNMDRLQNEKIGDLWSSIHTLFAENHGYQNITCIVSFDRKNIADAFKNEENPCVGDDYIDKTFDVVYRVAPPVLSDWKNFFKKQWLEAFGHVEDENEYHRVVQAYDLLSGDHGLTPRSIKKFINECVLIKQISGEDIPWRYVAIFILRKTAIMKDPISLECLGYLKKIYENDADYHKYITGLVYQVPSEKAMSSVYVFNLKNALDRGDQDELDRISKADFFVDIIDDAIKSVSSYDNAIETLETLPSKTLNPVVERRVWSDLYCLSRENGLEKFDKSRLYGTMKPSQEILLKHLDANQQRDIVKSILKPFAQRDFKFGEITSVNYVDLVKRMNNTVSKDILEPLLPALQILPSDYIAVLQYGAEYVEWIPFVCDSLENYLSGLSFQQLLELDCLLYLPKKTKKALDVDALLNNLLANQQIYNETYFLKLLKLFDIFNQCQMNYTVINWNLLTTLFSSTANQQLKGILLAIRILANNQVNLRAGNSIDVTLDQLQFETEIRSSLCDYIASRKSVEELIVDVDLLNRFPIVCEYVKSALLSGDYKISGRYLFDILAKLDDISSVLNENLTPLFEKMLDYYNTKKDAFDRLLAIQNIDSDGVEKVLPLNTIKFVIEHPSNFSEKLVSWITAYFDSYEKDRWIECFVNPNMYGVKEALTIKYEWSQNAKDAFEECLGRIVDGSVEIDEKVFNSVMPSFDENLKNRWFKNIRDDFVSGRKKINSKVFIFLGDFLIQFGFIEQCAGDVLRTIIPQFLLEDVASAKIISKHVATLENLKDEESDWAEWIQKAKYVCNQDENYPLKNWLNQLK